MNQLDVLLLVLFLPFTFRGYFRGLCREIFGLAGAIAGVLAAGAPGAAAAEGPPPRHPAPPAAAPPPRRAPGFLRPPVGAAALPPAAHPLPPAPPPGGPAP